MLKWNHNEIARATRDLSGNNQIYSRKELLKIVQKYYPYISDGTFFPNYHCIHHGKLQHQKKDKCCCENKDFKTRKISLQDAIFEYLDEDQYKVI